MGGGAFPNTERLDKDQFLQTRDEVSGILSSMHTDTGGGVGKWCSPKEVGGKSSYGDIDFLVTLEVDKLKLADFSSEFAEILGALDKTRNCRHMSFLTRDRHQVDVLVVATEDYDASSGYYSNGDFSHCLGKIIHANQLKWTDKGLIYRMDTPEFALAAQDGKKEAEIVLTKSTAEAFTYLGFESSLELLLDPEREICQEDLLEILSDNVFYRNFLHDEALRKRLFRTHENKRPMVKAFFEKAANDVRTYDLTELVKVPSEEEILTHFGKMREKEEKWERYNKLQGYIENNKAAKGKFSGHQIMDWIPDVSKKQIGRIFSSLKEGQTEEDYVEWVLRTDLDSIRLRVEGIYESLAV